MLEKYCSILRTVPCSSCKSPHVFDIRSTEYVSAQQLLDIVESTLGKRTSRNDHENAFSPTTVQRTYGEPPGTKKRPWGYCWVCSSPTHRQRPLKFPELDCSWTKHDKTPTNLRDKRINTHPFKVNQQHKLDDFKACYFNGCMVFYGKRLRQTLHNKMPTTAYVPKQVAYATLLKITSCINPFIY